MTAWLFGKLPGHGDFVARGLLDAKRDALDRFLSDSLAEARATLANCFDATFDEAPAWRFAWTAPGGWTAGAMAPSVDGVGRRYPILVARAELEAEQVEAVAGQLETVLYDTLAQNWTADQLYAAAHALVPESAAPWAGGEGWWTLGGERFNDTVLPGARPAGLMAAVLTPRAGEQDEA